MKDKAVLDLKRKLACNEKFNDEIDKKVEALRSKRRPTYELSKKIDSLSHRYEVKDVVVLATGEMAYVQKLVGVRCYDLFVACAVFKRAGTHRRVDEKSILCHALDLVVDKEHIKFKSHGWRCKE